MYLIKVKSDSRVIHATNGTIIQNNEGIYESSEGPTFILSDDFEVISEPSQTVPDTYISGLTVYINGNFFDHSDRQTILNQKTFEKSQRITESNWTQMPDSGLSSEDQAAWTEYRKQVRDAMNVSNPLDIVFPLKPGEEPVF